MPLRLLYLIFVWLCGWLSAVPVHYRDAKGVRQDIDPSVKPVSHDGFTAGAVRNRGATELAEPIAARPGEGDGNFLILVWRAEKAAPRMDLPPTLDPSWPSP